MLCITNSVEPYRTQQFNTNTSRKSLIFTNFVQKPINQGLAYYARLSSSIELIYIDPKNRLESISDPPIVKIIVSVCLIQNN